MKKGRRPNAEAARERGERRRTRLRKNWAERFATRAQRTPLLVLLSFAAVLISSVVVVSGAGVRVWNWYRHKTEWRTAEYRKLRSLAAGYSLEQFKSKLGAPLFVQTKRHLVEDSFRGRGYWVQTVSDRRGVVQLYAVTSCALDFRPTFSIFGTSAKLNGSTFADIAGRTGEVHADYFLSGATANSYFIESFYGGNPSNYKTYAWGIDDACPTRVDYYKLLARVQHFGRSHRSSDEPEYHGETNGLSTALTRFRRTAVVNTYAETAPFVDIERLRRIFQIGVDRILIRTAPSS